MKFSARRVLPDPGASRQKKWAAFSGHSRALATTLNRYKLPQRGQRKQRSNRAGRSAGHRLQRALLRYPDGWRWKDGELAPEIFDQPRSHYYDFGVQSGPNTCVLVPEFEVANDRALSSLALTGMDPALLTGMNPSGEELSFSFQGGRRVWDRA